MQVIRGLKLIATVPRGVSILAMTEFKGMIIIATSKGIYKYNGKKLEPVNFEKSKE
jgi:hypothetical protein